MRVMIVGRYAPARQALETVQRNVANQFLNTQFSLAQDDQGRNAIVRVQITHIEAVWDGVEAPVFV